MRALTPTLTGSQLFEHEPVGIKDFIESREYLDASADCWPSIKSELIGLFNCPPDGLRLSTYEEFVFDAGIGTGKSFLISVLFSYLTYRLLCLRSPQETFQLGRGSTIALVNMSKNGMQAKKVVFGAIKARIDNSPWFQEYAQPDPDIRSELRFPKDILIFPGNSEETGALGFTIFGANLDEAAFFTDNPGKDVAEDIYYALQRRIKSRFEGVGLLGITSSPRYVDDFIETKMTESRQSTAKHILGRTLETWNSRPDDIRAINQDDCFELIHPRTGLPMKIPNRYRYDFDKNPEKSWRDFGAVASLTLEAYIKRFGCVEDSIDPTMKDPVGIDGQFADWFKGDPKFTYFIHVDLALSSDACGFAMVHKEGNIVKVDLAHRIIGSKAKEIDITEVKNLVFQLADRGFKLGKVTYDQYQSASSIQEINKRGIKSEILSVDRDMQAYETMKELFYNGRMKIYNSEILLTELKRLELVEGKKVDHPAKGSKDVADAVAGATFNAIKTVVIGAVRVRI